MGNAQVRYELSVVLGMKSDITHTLDPLILGDSVYDTAIVSSVYRIQYD